MAVVFISPKQRQKTFFLGITVVFLLFLIFVSFAVFLAKPKQVPQALVFNKPKVNIDMKVFESEQFKKLRSFTEMEIQFSYIAKTKENKTVTGFISASSKEAAVKILEDIGLRVDEIKEVEIGRENPFTPYYETIINTTPVE
jgi:predicted tellurium resistance membrane protein TerC